MNAVKEKAYAKINLYIDVVGKRDDGFHDICTVMHSVSLFDDVTVTLVSLGHKNIRVFLDGNKRLPTDSKNLAYAAADAFLSHSAIDADIIIRLNKRIPISAGLAGGSSDAAATLRAMNKLFKRPFSDKALLSIAASIGSDVPYCLVGGTALCEGRGEKITRLPSNLVLYTVIASSKEHISTPRAYQMLDEMYDDFRGCNTASIGAETLGCLNPADPSTLKLYNIFEKAVLPLCPIAKGLKDRLIELGATAALMSGSGPSVYGIFADEDAARGAEKILNDEGAIAFYARSV